VTVTGQTRRARHEDRSATADEEDHAQSRNDASARTVAQRWTRPGIEWVLRGGAPERVVYGTILVGALIAAESGVHDGYVDKVGSTLLAMSIYWLAHSYSTILGRRIGGGEQLTVGALRRAMAHDWGIVRGASIPLLALLVCWLAGATQETGVSVAVWATIASLIAFELLAGIRSHSTRRELAFECGVGMAMGVAILALKSLAH
jgi:membrane protein YqaA with SNARE-associated domain